MNKIYSIISLLVAVFFTAACTDESVRPDSSSAVETTLVIEATPSATRTALDANGTTVIWQSSDQIAVYDYVSAKRNFAASEIEGNRAKFSGKVSSKQPNFMAVYPYTLAADNLSSGNVLSATLPATQTAVSDGFPLCSLSDDYVAGNISVARGERNLDGSPSDVTFHNVCQLLQFTVPQYAANKVSRITFTAPTDVAGKLSIDYTGSLPTTTVSGSQAITILPPRRSSTFPAGTYYIATAPVRIAGFSMSFSVGTKNYTLASSTTFGGTAGRVYTLGSIDLVEAPVISAEHIYNDGVLQGTSLNLTAPIEGGMWSATIKNSVGTVVRRLSGTGDLSSPETDSSWPYLPVGNYTVDYKYTTSNNKEITRTMQMSVTAPTLSLMADAYTAHSKYEAGDTEAANQCDRLTVYAPSATLSVAQSLMSNSNYTRSFTRSINSQTATTTETTNSPSWANYSNIPVSGDLYTFSVSANFAGTTVSASKQVRITGLPANFQPPTQGTGWTNDKGTTDFNSDHVRLGNYSLSQPHRIKNSTWFNIPQNTRVSLDYDIVLHRAAVNTTANVKMGDQQVVECTDSKYNNDVHNTGIKQFTTNAQVTSVTCEGSYGSGATCTKVYKLNFSYGK